MVADVDRDQSSEPPMPEVLAAALNVVHDYMDRSDRGGWQPAQRGRRVYSAGGHLSQTSEPGEGSPP